MAMLNNQMVRQTLIKNPPQNMGTDGRLKEPFGNTVYRIPIIDIQNLAKNHRKKRTIHQVQK